MVFVSALNLLTKTMISERIRGAIQHEYAEKLERIRGAIQHEYAVKLEELRGKLKSESDQDIEKLKAGFQVLAAERNVRYSRTFDRIAETVASVYAKLIALNGAAHNCTMLMEEDDSKRAEQQRAFQETAADFLDYYVPRKIYLPKVSRAGVEKLFGLLTSLPRKYYQLSAVGAESPTFETLSKGFEQIFEQIPNALRLLEDDFQRILGVDERLAGPPEPASSTPANS